MAQGRRVGAESSETRARILDAAEQVIREEGYAAASSRRIAAQIDLRPSLVHYYFPTTDDLFMAVFRRGAAESDRLLDAALTDPDPVRALWRHFTDDSRNALTIEFMAYASHRPFLREEIARHSAAMRDRQAAMLRERLGDRLDPAIDGATRGLSLVLAGIGRALAMETALGVTAGHAETRALVEGWLDRALAPQGSAPAA